MYKYGAKEVENVLKGNCVFNHANAYIKTLCIAILWIFMYYVFVAYITTKCRVLVIRRLKKCIE